MTELQFWLSDLEREKYYLKCSRIVSCYSWQHRSKNWNFSWFTSFSLHSLRFISLHFAYKFIRYIWNCTRLNPIKLFLHTSVWVILTDMKYEKDEVHVYDYYEEDSCLEIYTKCRGCIFSFTRKIVCSWFYLILQNIFTFLKFNTNNIEG